MAISNFPSTRLPWWEEDVTTVQYHRIIATALEQIRSRSAAALQAIQARAFISTVMVSCEVEKMSALIITPEEICRNLTRDFEQILHHCPPHQPLNSSQLRAFKQYRHVWSSSYSSPPHIVKVSFLSRLYQHLKALMFLCIYHRNDHLNMELLKETHSILMSGFRTHHHHATLGDFRDCSITNNGAYFIHEMALRTSIEDMLTRLRGLDLNDNRNDDNNYNPCSFFEFPGRLASLVHDMIHIHPFDEGNHWMCRLIMAHFLVSHDRFPFPVPIAPITDRLPEHFVCALLAADDEKLQVHEDIAAGFCRERAILSAYLVECVCESLEELITA